MTDQSSGELAVQGQRGGDGASVQYLTLLQSQPTHPVL